MALMLAKTYAALRAAGVSEQQAEDASAEIAGYERELSDIKGDLRLLKWMVGTHFAVTLGLLVWVAGKIGAL
jgi:hypothetical protein